MSFIINSIFQNIQKKILRKERKSIFTQRTNIYVQLTYLVSHLIEILKLNFTRLTSIHMQMISPSSNNCSLG